jgi:rhamnopyranosyl-N-acetylglucosaminyl-diphospho-decaprenol beta-1,3/1,4-galactofuranosyltransferase
MEVDTVGATELGSVAAVVVTYNRKDYLEQLLPSLLSQTRPVDAIYVVDNASTDGTRELLEKQASDHPSLRPVLLEENTGGSGGFHAGTKQAYEDGHDWFWLMDDDVEVLPDGLQRLSVWAERFGSIQGRRYDYDGSEFYWQYRLSIALGIPIPFAPAGFDESGFRDMNSGCFEGMFIRRDVVARIGLPDPRFFIYWDDSVYGWLASLVTRSVIVDEFVLKRTRHVKQWDMGVRHLNASSDRYRYYIMRNRGIMQHYFRAHGAYRPLFFAFGTALTFGKELIRLVAVERTARGTSHLVRGLRDGRRIARDRSFTIMQPLARSGA